MNLTCCWTYGMTWCTFCHCFTRQLVAIQNIWHSSNSTHIIELITEKLSVACVVFISLLFFQKKIYTFSFPKFKLEFKLMASTWPLIFFMEIPILPCLLMVSLKMLPWLFSHYSIVIFSHFCDWWWIDKVETWALDLTPLACKSIIELWAHLLHCHFLSILILTLSCLSPKKFQSNQF